MTIPRQFQNMPGVQPNDKTLSAWQVDFFRAMKNNVDQLAGFKGAKFQAIVRGDVTVKEVEDQQITGEFVAADYTRLATEVILLRRALNELIDNINQGRL